MNATTGSWRFLHRPVVAATIYDACPRHRREVERADRLQRTDDVVIRASTSWSATATVVATSTAVERIRLRSSHIDTVAYISTAARAAVHIGRADGPALCPGSSNQFRPDETGRVRRSTEDPGGRQGPRLHFTGDGQIAAATITRSGR